MPRYTARVSKRVANNISEHVEEILDQAFELDIEVFKGIRDQSEKVKRMAAGALSFLHQGVGDKGKVNGKDLQAILLAAHIVGHHCGKMVDRGYKAMNEDEENDENSG